MNEQRNSQICYARIRNQMQTRMDAEIVVYSKLRSKARISEIRSTGLAGKISQLQTLIKNQESEFWSYRQGLGRIRIEKQRSVLYNITINWLTQIGTE